MIIDTRAALSDDVLVFLDSADLIVQILTYDSMAIRSLAMAAETFAAIGYPPSKLRPSSTGPTPPAASTRADVEQALGNPRSTSSSSRTAISSWPPNNEGIAFVTSSPDAPIAKGVQRIADSLAAHLRERAPAALASPLSGGMPERVDSRPIGVFDSGVGGLTVLAELQRRLPAESTVYLGDNARTPYGPRPGR